MNYLKLIANAFWAGLYATWLASCLVFLLNDDLAAVGVFSAAFLNTFLSVAMLHVPLVALALPTAFACVRFFAAKRLSMTWLGLKPVTWFCAVALLLLIPALYLNRAANQALLSPNGREALRAACTWSALSCLIALTFSGLGQWRPAPRGDRYRIIAALSLAIPPLVLIVLMPMAAVRRFSSTTAHGPGGAISLFPPQGDRGVPRLVMIGIDTLSAEYLLPLSSAGRLPTFGRLIKEGASSRLNSIPSPDADVAWAALSTGAPPWRNGVKGATVRALPGPARGIPIAILPVALGLNMITHRVDASPARLGPRLPDFKQIIPSAGATVRVVGRWPGLRASAKDERRAGEFSPPDAGAEVAGRLRKLVDPSVVPATASARALVGRLTRAVAEDLETRDRALAILAEQARGDAGGMTAVHFSGMKSASRFFLQYHAPEEFGDVSAQELAAFSGALSHYYEFMDEVVGQIVSAAGPEAFVIVVSACGVQPPSTQERIQAAAAGWIRRATIGGGRADDPTVSGSWSRGPDGMLLLAGPGINAGYRADDADVLDVLPTALYVLGLPIGRDMGGRLLRRAFNPGYLETHQVFFIPGYAPSF